MPWTAQEYLERMRQTRAAHLKNIDTTGKRIQGIYRQAAADLADRAAAVKDKSLTERWLTDYQKAVQNRIEQMRGELGLAIRSGMSASARLPGNTVQDWLNDAFAMCGVDSSWTGTLSHTPDDALRALLDGRMYRDGKSLSRRIWNHTENLAGSIEDICAQGIAQKKSALALARDLEAYVNPDAKMPVSWLKFYPDIPFDRQIDYNAMRLARTMINHSYWAANVESALNNPFCQAMHWQLSASHFERQVARFGEDVCDEYASHDEGLGRGNFPPEKLPMPHAQCICAQYQVVPELDEVANRLSNWIDGGEDRELDRAFSKWKEQKGPPISLFEKGMADDISKLAFPAGEINPEIFKAITEDVTTKDVVITDRQIEHIKERHPYDYERYFSYIPQILADPDYIIEDKRPNTGLLLKRLLNQGEVFELVLRLHTSQDPAEFKNSVITFWSISEKRAQSYLRNKKVLYKKE